MNVIIGTSEMKLLSPFQVLSELMEAVKLTSIEIINSTEENLFVSFSL